MTWNARPVAPHNANSRPRHLTALVRICRWLQSQCVDSAAYVAITNAGFRHFFLLHPATLIGRARDTARTDMTGALKTRSLGLRRLLPTGRADEMRSFIPMPFKES